jgi:Flp pilus assembly protein TadG
MRLQSKLLRDFVGDEEGAFAVIFGLMAIVLIALGGSTVDFSMLQSNRATMQTAMDSAALALQPRIKNTSPDQLRSLAQDIVTAQMGGRVMRAEITDAQVDIAAGTLRLIGDMEMKTIFTALVGVEKLGAAMMSEATRKAMRIEIAMVLDNSASMAADKRMGMLQVASRRAVDIFFEESDPADPDVFVGVVPFTQFVNVGAHNKNAAWLDRFGSSPIASDNLMIDANSPIKSFNRLALHDQMKGNAGWRGCVEARPYPYDTDDTPPLTAETLFVPLFAPDEPDTWYWDNGWRHYHNNYLVDDRASCQAPPYYHDWDDRVLQERMCKYRGGTPSKTSLTQVQGPNADCPTNALTPLTSDRDTVRKAINGMSPQGRTNVAQGAVWGFHMLTPGEPLVEARAQTPDESISKVMILMTDGDNIHSDSGNMNGAIYYTAYGYPHNRRLGKPGDSAETLRSLMDDRLEETCRNAKLADIKIYTIGLGLTRQRSLDMLINCSSGDGYAFQPSHPDQLNEIFERIANQISQLRISR